MLAREVQLEQEAQTAFSFVSRIQIDWHFGCVGPLLLRGLDALNNSALSLQAISKDSKDAALLAARAAAQLKLGNNMEALEDAGKAVELQPGLDKAHLRKG